MIRETYINEAPLLYRPMLRRAFDGTARKSDAIKAKCLACTGFVRADVAACTSELCELHAYRPYQARRPREAKTVERTQAA